MYSVKSGSKLLATGLMVMLAFTLWAPVARAQETSQEGLQVPPASESAGKLDEETVGGIVVARTLAELPAVVAPGETVLVTDASGVRNKFKMQGVSADASTVLLERDGAIVSLSEDQVLNVAVVRGDRLWDGALKGALIGASPLVVAAIVCTAVDGCASEALAASLFTGLIGAGIGVGVDAMFKEEHLIYSAAAPLTQPRIVVAPMISGERKGAVVQIRF